MTWTPQENVEQLRKIRARAREGARAAAEAMARHVAERTANDMLQRSTHAPGEYYKSPAGDPPASASGELAAGMYWTRAQGGLRASASAGNRARHAKMLEFGCEAVRPVRGAVMHWTDSGGSWYHSVLPADGSDMPEHPFLAPTVDESVEDGSLRDVAVEAFREYDP